MSEETMELVEYLDVPVYEEQLNQDHQEMINNETDQLIDGEIVTIDENEMQEVQFIESDELTYDTAAEELQTVDGHTIIVHNGKQYMIPDEIRRAGQTIVLNEDEDGDYIIQTATDEDGVTEDTYYTTQVVDEDEEQQQEEMYVDEPQEVEQNIDDGCYLIYDDEDDLQTTETQVKQEPNEPLAKQYAVLKDGKLHIQTSQVAAEEEEDEDEDEPDAEMQQKLQALEDTFIYEADEREPGEITPQDDSDVTGTNLITGQTISLSRFFEKIRQRTNNYPTRQEPSDGQCYPENVKRQRRAYYQKTQLEAPGSDYVLVPPVHKQVVVGRTPDGKRIIGKILQIRKKIEPKAKPLVRRRPRIVRPTRPVLPQKPPPAPSPSPPPPAPLLEQCQDDEEDKTQSQLQKKLQTTHNVIVKKRYVSKAFLDQNIVRTLSGLMDMETIEKNLTGKNLIVRHVLKRSQGGVVLPGKEVTYYYGRMQRQPTVNCFNEPCSGWTFVSNQLSDDEDEGEAANGGIDLKLKQEDNQQIDVSGRTREMAFGALAGPVVSGGSAPKQQKDNVPTVTLILVVTHDEHGKKRTKVMIPQLAGNLQQQSPPTPPPQQSSFTWSCESCGKQYRTELQLQRHNCTHQARFTCHLCDRLFTTSNCLRRHLTTHDLDPDTRKQCDPKFSDTTELLKNTLLHTPTNGYTCELCNKRFTQLVDLNYHRKAHELIRKYRCNVCGKHFNRHSNMVRHAFVHRADGGNDGSPFRCETCGCQYNFVSSLTRHIVNKHMSVNESNAEGFVQEMIQEAIQA